MRNALFIIDMQNGFLEKSAPIYVPNGISICSKIKKALNLARTNNFLIVWTKVNIERLRNTQYQELFPQHFTKNTTVLSKGSHNYEITSELIELVMPNDYIVEKNSYSAFIDTDLLNFLTEKRIQNIFFTGVSTNVCVESTLRDAFQYKFNCALISDCTKSFSKPYQKLSEEIISFVFGRVINLNQFSKLKFDKNE
ncbi:MAG: cysteine hydrolase [Ferruginibacter sp.]|nr:cysteine hydrolase [Ferruginibacter sp.]